MDKETERLLKEKLINDKKKEQKKRNEKIFIFVCILIYLILQCSFLLI